jgi:prepilin-type N-terminal cleavage/methylation domain-containing protein
MSKGFTLIELVLTVIVLSILSAFTFSVIWQYSQLYGDTRKGYVYGEAAAVLERISRELKDAKNVDLTPFTSPTYTNTWLSFQPQNATPADQAASMPLNYWVQYCACRPSVGGLLSLYRILNPTDPTTNSCSTTCPPATGRGYAPFVLMSGNINSFQVKYFPVRVPPDPLNQDGDSYEITLQTASGTSMGDQSIRLITRAAPRNYPFPAGPGRSYSGAYYDEIK